MLNLVVSNITYCYRSDENGIATDPNSIKVGGDIKMDLDLNEAIKEDAKLQEASEWMLNADLKKLSVWMVSCDLNVSLHFVINIQTLQHHKRGEEE